VHLNEACTQASYIDTKCLKPLQLEEANPLLPMQPSSELNEIVSDMLQGRVYELWPARRALVN